MSDVIEERCIGRKQVFIFESHNLALYAWAKGASSIVPNPTLLTLDHHTDTRIAFLHFVHSRTGTNQEEADALRTTLCSQIIKSDLSTVQQGVWNLRHDEHIDAAIRANIIERAFVIQYSDHRGTMSIEQSDMQDQTPVNRTSYHDRDEMKMTYRVPDNRIFVASSKRTFDWRECEGADAIERRHFDLALEDSHLSAKLAVLEHMAQSSQVPWIDKVPYVLDIDLDYFHTAKSIDPVNYRVFSSLIRGASFITIAKETRCVETLRVKGEKITSDFLLERLLQHIEKY